MPAVGDPALWRSTTICGAEVSQPLVERGPDLDRLTAQGGTWLATRIAVVPMQAEDPSARLACARWSAAHPSPPETT